MPHSFFRACAPRATRLATFLAFGATALAHDWNGLVRDSAGAVYVVDAEDGYVWKVTPAGPDGRVLQSGKARGFVTGATAESMIHPHHLAIDGVDRLWLVSGCDKNLLWSISPQGALTAVEWQRPEEFTLETVAPDGRGGLWLIAAHQSFWMAKGAEPRFVASLGSLAGACAVDADGSLWLGDGPKLWRIALPHPTAGAKTAESVAEPIADGLGDVYGVALADADRIVVSDWEGGRVLAIARPHAGAKVAATAASTTSAPVAVLATGLRHPSGVLALEDGALLVKESGRQENGTPRLLRLERDGTRSTWVELVRDAE